MNLGSLNMAGSALGMAFCLLLLATITQGHNDDEESNSKTMEAVVGQSATLPCTLKSSNGVTCVSVEWRKKNGEDQGTKLAVFSPGYGEHLFTQHVSLINETKDEGNGIHLHFPLVKKSDTGIYICDIITFPLGILRSVIELKVKDIDKIVCDVEATVEVHRGENVIIQCEVLPNAHYKWTKDKMLVSKNKSLELWQVTDVHAGVYTLTVKTGNNNLQREFNIIVLTVTTSQTDLATVSPQSNVTREGLTDSADSSFTTSSPTGLLATDTSVTRTVSTNNAIRLLAIIIIPVLALIAVICFLYRRHIIKQRMDLPPPFKPPPPPVKYVAVGQSEISAKSFPISRCESVTYVY